MHDLSLPGYALRHCRVNSSGARLRSGRCFRVMNDLSRTFLIASIYRYALILAGCSFAYMGYRLFKLGYFEKAGELKASYGGKHFLLKQVAPGVFYAAFGVATIVLAVVRQVTVIRPVVVPVSTTASEGPSINSGVMQSTPCMEERVTGQGPKSAKGEVVKDVVEGRR